MMDTFNTFPLSKSQISKSLVLRAYQAFSVMISSNCLLSKNEEAVFSLESVKFSDIGNILDKLENAESEESNNLNSIRDTSEYKALIDVLIDLYIKDRDCFFIVMEWVLLQNLEIHPMIISDIEIASASLLPGLVLSKKILNNIYNI